MLIEDKQTESRLVYLVEAGEGGRSIKEILKGKLSFSSRLLTKIKQGRNVLVNGQYRKYHEEVSAGDIIEVFMDEPPNQFLPQNIPFEVLYEDVDLIIVNKQPGIVSHPTKSHPINTMANGAAYYLQQRGSSCRIRFVNRLDMDTSGLLIIAKNPYAHHIMSEQMKKDQVRKKYITFVEGRVQEESGTISAPIYRPSEDAICRVVDERGQASITKYRVMERFLGATMLEIELLTGRTHQIRVHMSHIGHPIIGDTLYGKESPLINRQALQAYRLEFLQPRYRKPVYVRVLLAEDMEALRSYLQQRRL